MENEEYTPEKPVYYNYGIKNFLVKDIKFIMTDVISFQMSCGVTEKAALAF